MTIAIIGFLVFVGVLVVLAKKSNKDDCCGVEIAEQEYCNIECKNSPYKE